MTSAPDDDELAGGDPGPGEVHLRVGPYTEHNIAVHFEPTGMVHPLEAREWLNVTMRGPHLGLIEIGHTPDAVIVGSWPDAEVFITSSNGTVLEV